MAHMAAIPAAVVANALSAIGPLVELTPESFLALLEDVEDPLIVTKRPEGAFSNRYQYLLGHKGLVFHTKSRDKLPLPPGVNLIDARRIWIPSM